MNACVETNFVLELVFQQEQSASCKEILEFCTAKKLRLIIPAYSLLEPYEKLIRQRMSRKKLQKDMDAELNQLLRTACYQKHTAGIQEIYALLVQSSADEKQRLSRYRNILLENAEIIPMTAEILAEAVRCESRLNLQPQDAVVYASALAHLQQSSTVENACFLNRNAKDFGTPELKQELARHE